jgi:uracil-DNA glycosylase
MKPRYDILDTIKGEYYPPRNQVFRIIEELPTNKIKVVILGQDCYHSEGQANGLAFSVNKGVKIPPSLRNIFKEIKRTFPNVVNNSGDLSPWVKQGVFLLNCALTVAPGKPGSHAKYWKDYTDDIIKEISDSTNGVYFLLWGEFAKSKAHLIDSSKHKVLTAGHPSPLNTSQPFSGCNHFSEIPNIDWST